MLIAATNTVIIHAAPRQTVAVGVMLNNIICALRNCPGCLAYTAIKSHCEPNLWIVTGHWLSRLDMDDHFHNPAQEKYANLLSCKSVRSIEFNCRLFA